MFVLPDDPPSEELTDHGDTTRSSDADAAMPDRALAHVRTEFHQGPLPSPEALPYIRGCPSWGGRTSLFFGGTELGLDGTAADCRGA